MVVNGIEKSTQSKTISELLISMNLSETSVVVEVNSAIIERENYAAFQLNGDDVVEIVGFVGGG